MVPAPGLFHQAQSARGQHRPSEFAAFLVGLRVPVKYYAHAQRLPCRLGTVRRGANRRGGGAVPGRYVTSAQFGLWAQFGINVEKGARASLCSSSQSNDMLLSVRCRTVILANSRGGGRQSRQARVISAYFFSALAYTDVLPRLHCQSDLERPLRKATAGGTKSNPSEQRYQSTAEHSTQRKGSDPTSPCLCGQLLVTVLGTTMS